MVSLTCVLCICLAVCSTAFGETHEERTEKETVDKYVVDLVMNMAANMDSLTKKVDSLGDQVKQVRDVIDKSRHTEMDIDILKTKVNCLEKKMKSSARNSQLRVSHVNNSFSIVNKRLSKLFEIGATANSSLSALGKRITSIKDKMPPAFEAIRSNMANISTNLKQNLSDVSNIVDTILDRVRNLGSELFRSKASAERSLSTLGRRVTSIEGEMPAAFRAIRSKVADVSTALDRLTTEVGFDVWIGPDRIDFDAYEQTTVKFKDVQYNKGGGYNPYTGVFTVPVSGTYLFWYYVKRVSGKGLSIFIWTETTYLGTYYDPWSGWATGDLVAAASLRAGDRVYASVKGAHRVVCCSGTRFGGALLYRH